MRHLVLQIFVLFILTFSLSAQSPVRTSSESALSADWEWATSEIRRQTDPGWIGYSVPIEMPAQIWMGDFNLRIFQGRVEIAGGESLENLLTQNTATGSLDSPKVALLFSFDGSGNRIERARFQSLHLPHQGKLEPLYWLGHRDIQASLDHLFAMFQQQEQEEGRAILVTAIGLHPSPRVLPFLQELLRTGQPRALRERAAASLAFQDSAEAVVLAKATALNDPQHEVREEAVEALEDMSIAQAEETLIELLSTASLPDVRLEAAEALGNKPSNAAAEALKEAAAKEEENVRVRLEAVEALGEQGLEGNLDRLQRVFSEASDRRIKMEIIEAFGEQNTAAAHAVLQAWLWEADDRGIQMEALEALAENPDGELAKRLLVKTLEEHPDPRIRSEALEELADRLAAEAVAEISRSAQTDPHSHVRREAVEILGEIGDDASIDALIAVVTDSKDPVLKRFAIEALAESGHPRAREVLVRLARGNQ